MGRFRAVLWQQGESDVIAKTSVEQYIRNLQLIRKSAARTWGFEPEWLLAKSTHHPTVYNDPLGEGQIRDAIEQLTGLPGFGIGPDTDTLQGENRGDVNSRRHFSAIGQARAADLWYQVLAERLRQVPAGIEAASFLLSDLKLRQPAWQSEVVVRESSIVLQANPGSDGLARLAFPPAEILQVTTADRSAMLPYTLAEDSRLYFAQALLETESELQGFMRRGIGSIKEQDLFPPKDSPHSYQHRIGNPEQNLLYQPGRWFHDRNIEVTYRRDLTQEPLTTEGVVRGELPKTLARLRTGQPITLGISGDSISTGLDASVMTDAPPFQPGYAELVVAQLQVDFESQITLKNRAVAGWSVANGVADLDGLLAEQPHLIIVAYGMNDVGRRDPQWYADQTRAIIQQVQARSPDTEILLVATMLGNSQWVHTPRDMFDLYRDELAALVGPGVALADLTAVWELLLKRKHDNDLTGNGLNHPNDFGHRLYAQAVLQLLPQ
jgi:lysophospholipase L1-like esterase